MSYWQSNGGKKNGVVAPLYVFSSYFTHNRGDALIVTMVALRHRFIQFRTFGDRRQVRTSLLLILQSLHKYILVVIERK